MTALRKIAAGHYEYDGILVDFVPSVGWTTTSPGRRIPDDVYSTLADAVESIAAAHGTSVR